MINLIPNEEKKKMTKNFYWRFLVVVLFMLGSSVLLATVAILPAYYASSIKQDILDSKLASELSIPPSSTDQETMAEYSDLRAKLSLMEKTKADKFVVSERVVNPLLLKKISGIRINKIFYEEDPAGKRKASLNGRAGSRETLLLFKKILEDSGAFQKVDLPVSNFVQGSNIGFYLNLTPHQSSVPESQPAGGPNPGHQGP